MTDQHFHLTPFDEGSGALNVIIETPKGSRNKFNFDAKRGLFKLGGVLPAGAVFPFDFGFVPGTLGDDGDPLDVLLLMDEPAFTGCWVEARLLGVIEAEQTERDGKIERNDRLIAVAANSHTHRDLKDIHDINANLLEEIEHFFASYNEAKGKQFQPLHRRGAKAAEKCVRNGEKQAAPQN
jgi:inorganic pyrophosphatase